MHRRQMTWGHWLRLVGTIAMIGVLTSCSARLGGDEEEQAAPDAPSVQLRAWSELHSDPYGIPQRALQAYAYAAAAMDKANPSCGIGWSTLAALGSASSDHGTADGASIDPNGDVTPVLRNLQQARAAKAKPVADTDAGRFDGTDSVDEAMGPMQIMPSRWEQFATDADNNGKADPDNIDDATLSAARFLCAAGGDLRQSDGWYRAISQFNGTPGFAEKVHAEAAIYGR